MYGTPKCHSIFAVFMFLLKVHYAVERTVVYVKVTETVPFSFQQQTMSSTDEELSSLKKALSAAQKALEEERAKHNRTLMTLKLQLYHSQMTLKHERAKTQGQMQEVMSQLLFLEGKLKSDKVKVKAEIRNRDILIASQDKEILKLSDQNEQLHNVIREICAKGGMNGYMRDKKKNGHEKGVNSGKLVTVKDKFLAKNRSSLELNSSSLDKYLHDNDRLCSSHEDLRRLGSLRKGSVGDSESLGNKKKDKSPKDKLSQKDKGKMTSVSAKSPSDHTSGKHSQNFFSDSDFPTGVSKSTSESSYLSEASNTSGVYSMSDNDQSSLHDFSGANSSLGDQGYYDDDDDDEDRIFNFSSTHINTVIDEEDVIDSNPHHPHHHRHMMSMGSMPNVTNIYDNGRFNDNKNRPHSLSSMDLATIQQHTHFLSHQGQLKGQTQVQGHSMEDSTPPSSPSNIQAKAELTPFQTFKTMFKRKGSKNKGKKRSVSLSNTTTTEYSEALRKHFQKYDMQ